VPYHFRTRQWGKSKLKLDIEVKFFYLLASKILAELVSSCRFLLSFLLWALSASLLHLSILSLLYRGTQVHFVVF
jgi:hypothetical protein